MILHMYHSVPQICNLSLSTKCREGGGLMCRIKIPQQDFALKMQGRLMYEGGRIAGHYGLPYYNTQNSYLAFVQTKM